MKVGGPNLCEAFFARTWHRDEKGGRTHNVSTVRRDSLAVLIPFHDTYHSVRRKMSLWRHSFSVRSPLPKLMEPPFPITRKEWHISLVWISVILMVLLVSSLLLFTTFWFIWPLIVVVILVAVGSLTGSKKSWQCPSCGAIYKITALQDFLAPHGISKGSQGELLEWKSLKCTSCSKRSKCFPVRTSTSEAPKENDG